MQEAQDIALTAHALAIRSGKGVIHFFDTGSSAEDTHIAYENSDVVRDILNLDTVKAFQSTQIGGSGIYADDGRVATISETHAGTPIPGAMEGVETAQPILAESTPAAILSKASSIG